MSSCPRRCFFIFTFFSKPRPVSSLVVSKHESQAAKLDLGFFDVAEWSGRGGGKGKVILPKEADFCLPVVLLMPVRMTLPNG